MLSLQFIRTRQGNRIKNKAGRACGRDSDRPLRPRAACCVCHLDRVVGSQQVRDDTAQDRETLCRIPSPVLCCRPRRRQARARFSQWRAAILRHLGQDRHLAGGGERIEGQRGDESAAGVPVVSARGIGEGYTAANDHQGAAGGECTFSMNGRPSQQSLLSEPEEREQQKWSIKSHHLVHSVGRQCTGYRPFLSVAFGSSQRLFMADCRLRHGRSRFHPTEVIAER